ncbi:MAG: restriction endonuclease subunit S [Actinomycetes bacterium]
MPGESGSLAFREHSLADLVSEVVDNRGRSCPTTSAGFPLIATNCIKDDLRYPVFENVRYISVETRKTWFRAHPEPGDIVFVCKGSPGRVALVPNPVTFAIAQDMVALRADKSLVDPIYLYYLLESDQTRAKIENLHVGTMIPHFKKGDFDKLRLSVHDDLSEQARIAHALGAMDKTIELNRQLIRGLDDLSDAAFDAWAETVDSSVRFDQVVGRVVNGVDSSAIVGGTVYLGLEHFGTDAVGLIGRGNAGRVVSNKVRFQSGDVLYGKLRPYFRKVARPGFDGVCTTEAWVLRANGIASQEYAHWLVRRPEFTQQALAGSEGTKMPRASWQHLCAMAVPNPGATGFEGVSAQVATYWNAAIALQAEVDSLTKCRNELLPLLLTGRLAIREVTE